MKTSSAAASTASNASAASDARLHLRPHHLLCIQNYRGHGYSSDFDQKMTSVIEALRSPSGAEVVVTGGADDLCGSCPHCRDGSCESDNPGRFDSFVCAHTQTSPGDTFTWKLSLGTDMSPVPPVTKVLLEKCCSGCSWLDLCLEILSDSD